MPAGLELDHSPVLLIAPPLPRPDSPPAWAVDILTLKPLPEEARAGEVALFVTHSPAGTIKPHVLPYVAALGEAGIAVLLIVVTDRPVELPQPLVDQAAGVIVRANAGWDFGAWAHVLHLDPGLYGAHRLYLLNDSLYGPSSPASLAAIIARVRDNPADLVGLTASHEWHWHIQSYFLALGPRLMSSYALHDFMRDVRLLDEKDAVIHAYEARLTSRLEEAGHSVAVLFDSPAAINPTLFDWRGLIERGFPFVKLLLLRGAFAEADIDGWRETLAEAGFDLDLLSSVLLPAPSGIPDSGERHLLARWPALPPLPERPLRVAFFGPWNHDNGLGAASRNLIVALRRTGARINLSPVRKPFHVHRPLGPSADIREFEGPADIALVHLNPDSWHLLDDTQRHAILRAGRRIGYWVWEMETLPPAWNADLWNVDRIWAPSQWCAEVFARETDATVDVIPHPLPPEDRSGDRSLIERLGVRDGERTILYVFDGSSYLVRKNPAALVRAFAASGLGGRGWRLLLKTKHLMDRPEDGAALRELAEGTQGVLLIDRAMAADELAGLMAACDIYASPHCAEGFGLTVAEAMAAGRAVVATDYSGTRDMLDPATGWPVRARQWVLDEDHGHYLAGYGWARVDEPALAFALTEAAAAVEAGERTRQEAAAARIAAMLAPDAVAARMAESFRDTLAAPPRRAPVPRVAGDIARGLPLDSDLFGPLVAASIFPGPVADGDSPWVALLPRGTLAAPTLETVIARWAAARPDAALFIGDDFARDDPDQLRLFPEFDPALLAARGYDEAALVIRRDALARLGEAEGADDLLLRAAAAGLSIVRLPEVLMARHAARPAADAAARQALLARHLPELEVTPGQAPGLLEVARRFAPGEAPAVTLIVPTRRSAIPGTDRPYVARLLDALGQTDWPMERLSVIVGDDIAGRPDWAEAPRPYRLRHIETPRAEGSAFNYAAKMNGLWRAAETEQLVFLNDDLIPEDGGWLKALLTFAVERDVGGVGARLSYEDGRVQHAGIMPYAGRVGHAWAGRADFAGTYQDWALAQRQWSMVTGAVFATRASAMAAVNGFDEAFTLEYNDIDLCLRLRAAGYRIVYTPAARLVHAEKASRGEVLPRGDEIAAFLARWQEWLADDPAWHPLLDAPALEVTPRHANQPWYG
nr:glycosyltransferase [Sphingomonas quercus]